MAMFGRKGLEPQPPGGSAYPDFLDVRSAGDVAWIKASGDPLVWHDAALACLLFLGDEHGLIGWLAEQPTLDRATALSIILHGSNGQRHLRGEPLEYVRVEPDALGAALAALCARDARQPWADNRIAVPSGWEEERVRAAAEFANHPGAPHNLLAGATSEEGVDMPYLDIGEGELTSRDYMRREMPFML